MFGSTIWNKSISAKDRLRLSVNLNRVAIMNCKKYDNKVSKRTLHESSGLHSLTSLCTIADCTMLYNLCTGLSVEPLCERLMSQCHTSDRFPNRTNFFDYSRTRVGRGSFVNRAKYISELFTFDWVTLNPIAFKRTIQEKTSLFMKWIYTVSVFILCFNWLFVLYASNIVVIGAGSIKVTIQYNTRPAF